MGPVIRPFSAAALAERQVLSYCLTILTFNCQISRTYCEPRGRFIICDLITNWKQLTFSWQIYMLQTMMTTQFFYLGLWADSRLFSAKRSFIGGIIIKFWMFRKIKIGGLENTKPWTTTIYMETKELRNTRQTWFFLVSQCTSCNSINTDIVPGYNTDHSLVSLQIWTYNAREDGASGN